MNATASAAAIEKIRTDVNRRKILDQVFVIVGLLVMFSALLVLAMLFIDLVQKGAPRLNLDFLSQFPSRKAERAGILSAWVGTSLIMLTTAAVAMPVGVAAAIYLEEYAPKNWITAIIEINVTNLAGVPSIDSMGTCAAPPSTSPWWARASPTTPAACRSSPAWSMQTMKCDMAGAARSLAAMLAIAAARGCRSASPRTAADGREHGRPAPRCGPATCSRCTAARPSRCSTPTPRAGWSWPTRSARGEPSPTSSSTSRR